MIFWALDERDKRKERRSAERKQELTSAEAKGRDEGRAETDAEWREWYHRQVERGVVLEEPPTRDSEWSDPASAQGK